METLSYEIFRDSALIRLFLYSSAVCILIAAIFFFLPERKRKREKKVSSLSFVRPSLSRARFTKKDWRNMIMITAVYAIVSMYRLGSSSFPTTTWQPSGESQDIVFEIYGDTEFDAIYAIYNEGDNNSNPDSYQLGFHDIEVYGSSDRRQWELLTVMEGKGIFEYKIYEGEWDFRYIRISSRNKNDTITEFALRNPEHTGFLTLHLLSDSSPSEDYPAEYLTDEQDLIPLYPTYYEEAYFDEVYHPRNAWEIANGQRMYATVHPLFGTNLMALSIKLLGLNPFAWRLPGALFGIMMIPLLYAIAKLMFHKTFACTSACVLLAADFMHITTSRIGTLEPFSVFFIMLMYYYMIRCYLSSFYDTPLKEQLKTLFLCGLFMGIAIATKWTGCYSAVGLAILLFANLIRRIYEYVKAKDVILHPDEYTEQQIAEASHIRSVCIRYTFITLLCCIIFFIVIPAVIYCLSYLPDHVWKDDVWSVKNVWKQILYIYNYHKSVTATHPYQSTWYMWLLDLRPIWYHQSYDAQGMYHTIACFSNPLLCWAGIFTVPVCAYFMCREKKQTAFIIVSGYLCALGPWLLVDRCVFSYHFYPTSIFVILSIVFVIDRLMNQSVSYKPAVIVFLSLYVLLFILYLPVTAGFGTSNAYIKALEVLPGWYFG